MLQTGARLVWDIEFGKILSLASDVPSDVRLECQGCKWAIKTSQVSAIDKTRDDRIHSSGSSSRNVAAPLPKLDVRQTLAEFPLIDVQGNLTAIFVYMSTANGSFRLLRLDRTLCGVWSSIPEVEETVWDCS